MGRVRGNTVDLRAGTRDRRPARGKSALFWVTGFLIASSFFFLGGCATYPTREETRSRETFGNGYEEVWEAVVATLREGNWNIKTMEKDSGRIVADDTSLELRKYILGRYDSAYCFCVLQYPRDVLGQLLGTYTVALTREKELRTSVNIDAPFQATLFAENKFAGWLPCPTKGVFEPFFLYRVKSLLRPPKPPSRNFEWWIPSRGY